MKGEWSRETTKISLTAKTKIILTNKKINKWGTSSIKNQPQHQNKKIINDWPLNV